MLVLMYRAMSLSPYLSLTIAIPAGLLLVRTFIIMHDCAHGSFFSSRRLNDAVGWICGVLTVTPFT